MSKKFLEIRYKAPQSTPIENHEDDKWKFSLEETNVFKSQVIKEFNDFVLDSLYKEFLESEASHLVLIDKKEFNIFLIKYLPMYVKEENENYFTPTSVDECLWLIHAIGGDYDGYNTVEDLKRLIDELVEYAVIARKYLRQNKLFGSLYND